MAIPDFPAYGELIYALPAKYPSISHSTLVLASIGPTLAKLDGQVTFQGDEVLDVWKLIDLDARRIRNYSYEVYRAGEKVLWYDPMEHPHIPELASTHPHHRHTGPDIKHNRAPAPGISFTEPNLPYLIQEVERLYLS